MPGQSIPPGVPLSQIPALQPPPGVMPNFIDPPSIGGTLVAVNIVFLALMLIVVSVKTYTKEAITSYLSFFFVKLSILLLYLRLFAIERTMRYLIWGGISLQVIGYAGLLGHVISLEVECYGKTATTHSLCVNSYKVIYVEGIFSVVTDFYILLLPVRNVLGLKLSWRRRMGVLGVFMTGLLAVEINTGIIAGALNIVPIFLEKSGMASAGDSAMVLIRSRLVGRSQGSDHSGPMAGSRSGRSAGKVKIINEEGRYFELNKLPKTTATAWGRSVTDGIENTDATGKISEGGIVRTDDYEISYPAAKEAQSSISV
ncbi:MAG: hypothetical protein Q9179_005207 [Wetmoreana sp. 5 TL-2023]